MRKIFEAGGVDEDTVRNNQGCSEGGNGTSSTTTRFVQIMKRKIIGTERILQES